MRFPAGGRARAAPFGSRKHLPSRLARLRQLDGPSAVRIRGQGTEFDSLRDWVDGDDVRSIDWRATARRQCVVVRTWQPERDRHVVLVLDTSRTAAARIGDVPRLDAAMDAALLLAALASRADDRVSFLALAELVSAMAPLEPALLEADWTTLAGALTSSVRHRALVVLFTPLEPAAFEERCSRADQPAPDRDRVRGRPGAADLVKARGEDDTDVYDLTAAEPTLALRERTAGVLARLGVDVVDADPANSRPASPTTTSR